MYRLLAFIGMAALLLTSIAWKSKHCCSHCGCHCETVKVCHAVCETKKVPKTCYSCKCEDICVPGPCTLCGEHCECKEDPCRPGCSARKSILDWIPGCAYVKTRHVLEKKEIEVEQKTYQWVVEELCPQCAAVARGQRSAEEDQTEMVSFESAAGKQETAAR